MTAILMICLNLTWMHFTSKHDVPLSFQRPGAVILARSRRRSSADAFPVVPHSPLLPLLLQRGKRSKMPGHGPL